MVDTPVTEVTIGATLSSSFTQAFDRARATYDRFESSVVKLNRTLGEAAGPYERMLAITDQSTSSMRAAAYSAREVDRQYATVIGRMTALGTTTDTANRAIRDQSVAMNEASRSTALAIRGQTALQSALQRTADTAAHARDMVQSMSREMIAASRAVRGGGGGFDMPEMQRRIPYRNTMQEYAAAGGGGGGYSGGGGGGYGYGFGGGGRYGSGPTYLPPPPPPTFGQRVRSGFSNFGRGLANYASGFGTQHLVGAYIAERGLHELYSQGAERQDEYTKMAMAGQSPRDIARNRQAAFDVAGTVGGTTVNQNLAAERHLRYVFGNTRDARTNLGAVQQATKVMGFMNPNIDAERNSFDMAKALEIYGVSQDPSKFRSTMHRMEASSIATGGKITGRDFQQFVSMTGGASTALTPEALTGLVTSIGGEIGASRAGNAYSMAIRGLVGGRMPKQAMNALGRFGLMDRQRGRVVGANDLMSDPMKWVNTYLIPTMKSAGYYREDAQGNVTEESKKALTGVFAKIFSNKNEANLFTLLTTQGRRYQKDQEQVNAANRTNFEAIIGRSPTVAFNNMRAAFQNMLGTMSESDMSHAVAIMNTAARGFNAISRMDPKALGSFTEITGALIAMGPAVYGARLAFATFITPIIPLGRALIFTSGQILMTASRVPILGARLAALGTTMSTAGTGVGSFTKALGALTLVFTALEGAVSIIKGLAGDEAVKTGERETQKDYDYFDKQDKDPNTGFFGRMYARTNKMLDRGVSSLFLNGELQTEPGRPSLQPARPAVRRAEPGYTFQGPARIPGHAYGGSFTVKGGPGTDANLVQFMATAGEKVTVETEGSRGSGGGSSITPKEVGQEIGRSFADYLISHQRQLNGVTPMSSSPAYGGSSDGSTPGSGAAESSGGNAPGGRGRGGSSGRVGGSGGSGGGDGATPEQPKSALGRVGIPDQAVGSGRDNFGLSGRKGQSVGEGKAGAMGIGTIHPEAMTQAGPAVQGGSGAALATQILRNKEGIGGKSVNKAYWDVNHWRIGYGSDTMTDANGNVRSVHQGDRTTQADAERDLARRVPEFQEKLRKQVGAANWDRLDPATQGALTSVGYNYGSFAKLGNLRKAIASGDKHQIADAVRGLQNHNGGVNRARRLEEANIIETGRLPSNYKGMSGGGTQVASGGGGSGVFGLGGFVPQATPDTGVTGGGVTTTPRTTGGPMAMPGGGDMAARMSAIKRSGLLSDQQCVTLAMASVGIRKGSGVDGSNVHDWRSGDAASAGTLKPGTPVSTFLDRSGRETDRYAGGGSGTMGAHLDHAAMFENYTYDSQGRRTGMKVFEQYKGKAPHEKEYKFGQGWGEGNASNYHAVKLRDGSYMGGANNPMNSGTADPGPRKGDDMVSKSREKAAQRQKVASAGGSVTTHAPITVHAGNHNPQQVAELVQRHINRHEDEGARRARGGTFDWTA